MFKSIQHIKDVLPEVLHIVMFYNNGIVYQTTFKQHINIPKLGENLAEVISDIRKIYSISDLTWYGYKKLVVEAEDVSIIILQLGEDTNIALFFQAKDLKEVKLNSIRRYLKRIEKLIDMSKVEILFAEMGRFQEESNELKIKMKNIELEIEELKVQNEIQSTKELDEKYIEFNKIEHEIKQIEIKIEELQKNIEEIRNNS